MKGLGLRPFPGLTGLSGVLGLSVLGRLGCVGIQDAEGRAYRTLYPKPQGGSRGIWGLWDLLG